MFNTTFVSLSIVLVIGIFSISIGQSNGDTQSGNHLANETCKGEQMNSKVYDAGFKECAKQIFPQSSSTPKPMDKDAMDKEWDKLWKEYGMRMEVCMGKKQGYINADGSYNKTGSEKLIKAGYPPKVQTAIIKAFNECAGANSKSFSASDKCASFKGYHDCAQKKHNEICEIKA